MRENKDNKIKNAELVFELIVVIVNKGEAFDVVEASKSMGAEGGTIILGRGTGIHENLKILGVPIEPEKEIVLILVPRGITEKVLDSIRTVVKLDKPGRGIAFVVEVAKVLGISHLINKPST